MKKIFLPIALFCLLLIISIPMVTSAEGLVPCGKAADGSDACTICSFFQLLTGVYSFLVGYIAIPLATIALIIGGVLMMVSGGNPQLLGTGKTIMFAAIIGLVLVFGSYLIINLILTAIGYKNIGTWWSLGLDCS